MTRRVFAALAVLLALAPARATCGSAACFLVTDTSEGTPPPHALRLDLSFGYVDQSRKMAGTHDVDEVLGPAVDFENRVLIPDHHREIRTQSSQLVMALAYGVTERLSVIGSLPLAVDKNHEHWDGVGTPDEAFSNQAGTRGLGDLQAGVRAVLVARSVHLLLGDFLLKLPTGPYRLSDPEGAINEPTIQPGTGSYDGLVALRWMRRADGSRVEIFAGAGGRVNGVNSLGYRIGNEATLHAGASWAAVERVRFSLQLNARFAGRDGYLGADVPSTGNTVVNVTPGVRFGGASAFYLHLQLPVHERVNEAQLAPRFGFVAGIQRSF